jgi:hypothetical protein
MKMTKKIPDDEISRLVNKEYGFRPSSVTPVPSDDQLQRLLAKVADSQTKGLSWKKALQGDHHKLAKRLVKLGYKLHDGNECWPWIGAKANNSNRPQFEETQAYLFTIAALDNKPYETFTDFDSDHVCGNSLCVRPGLGHVGANLRSIHSETGKPDGVRPKAQRKAKPQ